MVDRLAGATTSPPEPGDPARPGDSDPRPEPSSTPADGAAAPPGRRRGALATWAGLLGAIAVVALALFGFSELRHAEFYTGTWDLGIYQQALWSTAHGLPFYESPDWETGGISSFLQVHGAFILYLVVPIYAAFPSPATLFAIQAVVVAAAGLPLYFLALQLTGSRRKAAIVAALYLGGAATLSSALYDFHVEAFVPLEYFAFLLFVERRQFVPAAIVGVIGSLSMEVLPVLYAAVGLYYAVPVIRQGWPRITGRRPRPIVPPVRRGNAGWTGDPDLRAAALPVAIVLGSLIAYYGLLTLRETWLATVFGFPPFPSSAIAIGYVVGGTPSSLGLSLSHLGSGFFAKVSYWLLLYALVGFLPVLAPRSLLLAAPWLAFTFLSANLNYVEIGFQYGFLAAPPLLVGAALGLGRVSIGDVRRWWRLPLEPRPEARRWRTTAVRESAWLVPAVLLIGFNLALSPFDPSMQRSGLGAAYTASYDVPPGAGDAQALAGLVPAGAAVVASDDLFPLVANDVHAYSFHWMFNPSLILPFDPLHPPPFVLVAENRLYALPTWLVPLLYNHTVYGVRGYVLSSPAGAVVLFASGYTGTAAAFGPPPTFPLWISPRDLTPGPAGWLAPDPGAPDGVAVETITNTSGLIWQGPYGSFPAGNYTVTFLLRAWPTEGLVAGTTPITFLNGNAYAQPTWLERTVSFGEIDGPSYVAVTTNLTIAETSMGVEFRGYTESLAAGVAVGGIALTPRG